MRGPSGKTNGVLKHGAVQAALTIAPFLVRLRDEEAPELPVTNVDLKRASHSACAVTLRYGKSDFDVELLLLNHKRVMRGRKDTADAEAKLPPPSEWRCVSAYVRSRRDGSRGHGGWYLTGERIRTEPEMFASLSSISFADDSDYQGWVIVLEKSVVTLNPKERFYAQTVLIPLPERPVPRTFCDRVRYLYPFAGAQSLIGAEEMASRRTNLLFLESDLAGSQVWHRGEFRRNHPELHAAIFRDGFWFEAKNG